MGCCSKHRFPPRPTNDEFTVVSRPVHNGSARGSKRIGDERHIISPKAAHEVAGGWEKWSLMFFLEHSSHCQQGRQKWFENNILFHEGRVFWFVSDSKQPVLYLHFLVNNVHSPLTSCVAAFMAPRLKSLANRCPRLKSPSRAHIRSTKVFLMERHWSYFRGKNRLDSKTHCGHPAIPCMLRVGAGQRTQPRNGRWSAVARPNHAASFRAEVANQ